MSVELGVWFHRSVREGSVTDGLILGQVRLRLLGFSYVSFIPPILLPRLPRTVYTHWPYKKDKRAKAAKLRKKNTLSEIEEHWVEKYSLYQLPPPSYCSPNKVLLLPCHSLVTGLDCKSVPALRHFSQTYSMEQSPSWEPRRFSAKIKVKFTPEQATKAHRGSSSTLSLTSALDGLSGQLYGPAALPPEKTRYPFYRRVGGSQGRSGRVRKISPPPGFDPRNVQHLAHRLRYPGPPTGSRLLKKFSAFYGTWMFVTAFTSARHLYLS